MPDAFARGRLGGFSFQGRGREKLIADPAGLGYGGLTLGLERGADFTNLGNIAS